jgi:hypothetical protein
MSINIRTMVASVVLVAMGAFHTEARAQFFSGFGSFGTPRSPQFQFNSNAGSINRNGNSWNVQHRGSTASGYYQGGNRPTVGGSYRDRQGNSFSGSANRDRINFDQRTSNGTQYGGYGYRNNDGWGAGGAYRDRNGTAYFGNVQQQSGRTSVNGGYRTKEGTAYSGGFQHGHGQTTVQGKVTKPGEIPGTTTTTYGQLDLRGRNSSVSGGREYYAGGQKLGGVQNQLDRHSLTSQGSVGAGPIRGSATEVLQFRGRDSQYQASQSSRVGPVNSSVGVNVNRQGVSGSATVSAFGQKTTINGSVKVPSTPNVKIPSSPPKVKMPPAPKVTAPPVPKVNVPVPSFSAPSSGWRL